MKHRNLPRCLPPYHPRINLNELVWGEIKGKVTHQHIGSSSLQQREQLLGNILHLPSIL